jgi:hypothetical protein
MYQITWNNWTSQCSISAISSGFVIAYGLGKILSPSPGTARPAASGGRADHQTDIPWRKSRFDPDQRHCVDCQIIKKLYCPGAIRCCLDDSDAPFWPRASPSTRAVTAQTVICLHKSTRIRQ